MVPHELVRDSSHGFSLVYIGSQCFTPSHSASNGFTNTEQTNAGPCKFELMRTAPTVTTNADEQFVTADKHVVAKGEHVATADQQVANADEQPATTHDQVATAN